jgi:CTP synthase
VGWRTQVVERALNPSRRVRIAVVGKYIQLQDAYKSIYEALRHGGLANHAAVEVKRVDSEQIEREGAPKILGDVQGILIPGGFGHRGIEGKLEAIRFARQRRVPFLGICLGMQCAVIEAARDLCGLKGANSTEFDPKTPHPVISLLEEQAGVTAKGGTMRLGGSRCHLQKGTKAFQAYGRAEVSERHRHRYEVSNRYRPQLEQAGLVIAGTYERGDLVEIMELKDHPWFVAGQFHPEFKSRPLEPHPLFRAFVKAALKTSETRDRRPETGDRKRATRSGKMPRRQSQARAKR